jgi:hypothetical protein
MSGECCRNHGIYATKGMSKKLEMSEGGNDVISSFAFFQATPIHDSEVLGEEWQDNRLSLLLSIDHKICFFSSARRFKASRGLS